MKPRGLFALTLFVFILLTGILLTAAPAQDQQFAKLGDVMLERGEILRDRRIGYRTYGKLNPAKSKAILFPTWAAAPLRSFKRPSSKTNLPTPTSPS